MNVAYNTAYGLSLGLAVIILLLAIVPAVSVSGLVLRKNIKSLNFRIWLNIILVGLITILSILRLSFLAQLGANSFELIPVNFAVSFLFVLVPLLATLGLTVPLLWKLRQPRETSGPVPLSDQARTALAAPMLVVPVQALLVGALLSVVITVTSVSLVITLLAGATLLVFAGWKWFRQRRFEQKLKQQGAAAIPRFVWRLAGRLETIPFFIAGFLFILFIGLNTTKLPDRYSMTMDDAHSGNMAMAPGQKMISVTDLTGPKDGTPDKTFTLTAQRAQVKPDSGETVDAWTFNGQLPGPELRVTQGDLVQVTLINKDVTEGVTLHWHGVDVPNAEDGVAGLTQDAVMPGQTFVYRFRANDAGTYWYHSHQFSNEELRMGLFGSFIVDPKVDPKTPLPANTTDLTILAHTWATTSGSKFAFGLSMATERKAVAPDSEVRLRLINTNNGLLSFTLTGTPFQVAAIDGTDLNKPGDLSGVRLPLAAGGRYDLHFVMPAHPVLLNSSSANLLLSPDGKGDMTPTDPKADFNPASYGQATGETVNLQSHFDQEYTLNLENGLGFYNGSFSTLWLINGQVYPNTPAINVKEGDLVKITFVNRSPQDHPMHPHGHKMLVLSRDGQAVSGSPWWTDTLNVAPGETITVALKADNPGLWMDHCHNLDHAASGMVMHLMYNNVMTPFQVGPASGNEPE